MNKINKPKPNKDVQQMSDDLYVNQFKKVMQNGHAPSIVRKAGDLNEIEVEGQKITRQEYIFIGDANDPDAIGLVKCQPTDNHFVYRYAKRLGWTLFCTCGSPSVVVGYKDYKALGSNDGPMLICMSMLLTKRHQDGGM